VAPWRPGSAASERDPCTLPSQYRIAKSGWSPADIRALSPLRRRLILVAAVTAALLLASAKFLGADQPDPCKPPPLAPAAQTALLPPGLSFAQVGPVTRVSRDGRYLTLLAYSDKPLDELTVLIQDAVVAAGYRPGGTDSEGFEAEVFFSTGRFAAGQARVRQSACLGRWDIDLVLLEPQG
jgi:hypothetical protein